MTDPKNQLHAAGTRRTAVPPRLKDPKACSNAFGDNPVKVLVPLSEFNLCVIAGKPAVWFGFCVLERDDFFAGVIALEVCL
jgi:hypothetical protein